MAEGAGSGHLRHDSAAGVDTVSRRAFAFAWTQTAIPRPSRQRPRRKLAPSQSIRTM